MSGERGSDELIGVAVVLFLTVIVATWGGAFAAAFITGNGVLNASIDEAIVAVPRLIDSPGSPRDAWPPKAQAQLPGPLVYWVVTALVVAALVSVVVWLYLWFTSVRVGMRRPRRLGVRPGARLAGRKDLGPLVVDSPVPGRFVFGEVAGLLVATEDRSQPQRGRRGSDHRGDRSCLGIFGPPRSGKTVTVVSGVLDWDGPAILSSVKGDMLRATLERRRQLGRVFVFDPFCELDPDGVIGAERVGWSPLLSSGTIAGAQQAAQTLVEAAPANGMEMGSYWLAQAKSALWPMLFAAALDGRSMTDVTRWLALQDGAAPATDLPAELIDHGEVAEILRAVSQQAGSGPGASRPYEAALALVAYSGVWRLPDRNRSGVFSTAQTLVEAWQHPFVAAASGQRGGAGIDLASVLSGRNTLYVVQPLRMTRSASVVFGGLLGDLLRDQAYSMYQRSGAPIGPLLAVLDEAGNTPTRWLPEVASTCASIGVQMVTVWQSVAQIRPLYRDNTDALLGNHGTLVFFAGLKDRPSSEYVTHLAGDEEVEMNSSTADVNLGSGRRSLGASTTSMKLVPADVLRQMPDGTALMFHNTLPPAHLTGRKWWEDRRLLAMHRGLGPTPTLAMPDVPELSAAVLPDHVVAHLADQRLVIDAGSIRAAPSSQRAAAKKRADDVVGEW